jgi:hypothetical protein
MEVDWLSSMMRMDKLLLASKIRTAPERSIYFIALDRSLIMFPGEIIPELLSIAPMLV